MEKETLKPTQNVCCDSRTELDQQNFRNAETITNEVTGPAGRNFRPEKEAEVEDDVKRGNGDEDRTMTATKNPNLQYTNMVTESTEFEVTWPGFASVRNRPRLGRLPEVENEQDDEHQSGDQCHNYVNDTNENMESQRQSTNLDLEQQLNLLRDLLAIERVNNEQRHQNNLTMKSYLQQLQADYLRLQSDLMQALEFGHKLKAQKDSQISCLETNLSQKDNLIEQLKIQLSSLDEGKLRAEFKAALEKQQELHHLEQDQLRQQISSSEQQLCRERVNSSQLLQQFQEKLDDQLRLHERELETMKSRLAQAQGDLERILSEPQNLLVRALREDKSRLDGQVEELNLALEENRKKYDSMRKRLELLLLDQERLAQQNQEEFDRLQQTSADQRRALNELKLELEDKQEFIQVLDFNLQRSEKRVKNLLASLKNREVTYREMIGQTEARQRQDLEELGANLQSAEKRLIELESELSTKQNELIRLRLEQENQLESLRNDRDERLNKIGLEKSALFKELQAVELKLARECELSHQREMQAEHLQREVQQFREESKRLSIDLTQSEAKLYAKQQELQIALRTLDDRDAEHTTDTEVRNKLALTQRELDEERGHTKRLKTNIDELKKDNEKLCAKLRIAEANLDKTRSAINREHEKLMREYEKKIESIRSEQASFDRNKLRYKRYGYKLKKYCEHLKRVHEHLCTPNNCGYIIGSNSAGTLLSSTGVRRTTPATMRNEPMGLLDSDGDEQYSDSPYYDDISGDENDLEQDSPIKSSDKSPPSPNRFIIKRTGLSPALSSPVLKTKVQTANCRGQSSRAPLRSKSTNLVNFEAAKTHSGSTNFSDNANLSNANNTNQPKQPSKDHHCYYYIRDDGSTKTSRPEAEKNRSSRLTAARTRKVTIVNQQRQTRQQQVPRTII